MTLGERSCPVRKLAPPDERSGPDLEWVEDQVGGRWVVRSFELVRRVLRDESGFHQAGFGASTVTRSSKMRPPILYLEGPEHRERRSTSARLFAPKVTESYRPMMTELSERLVDQVRADRPIDLSRLSLRMAVEVAARVVGLTNSSLSGMTRRLNTFFEGDPISTAWTPSTAWKLLRAQTATLRFYYLDVKPAIRARRRVRRDDVISQTLDQGFSDLEVLTECLTYGAAGMVTTREFITVAAWHLISHPQLLEQYLALDVDGRRALLAEALRVEPVVGHLFRRAVEPTELSGPDGPVLLPAGAVVDLDIRAANADALVVGAEPLEICPGREFRRGIPPAMMSFGDGHHRCPGAPLAIMESEIFLSTLFTRRIVSDGPPRVQWNAVSQGYDLDGFMIRSAP